MSANKRSYTPAEIDNVVSIGFRNLNSKIQPSQWTEAPKPISSLREELLNLMAEPAFNEQVESHVLQNHFLKDALDLYFAVIGVSADAAWHDAPEQFKPFRARGWFLGRWIPCFLVINGPVGRLLTDSFLTKYCDGARPMLSGARAFISDPLFRMMRNGLAHWSMRWDVGTGESQIVAHDRNRTETLRISEVEGFYLASVHLIKALYDLLIFPYSAAP